MRIILIILISLTFSCTSKSKIKNDLSNINNSDNIFYLKSSTIDDFLIKIDDYTKKSGYPNLEDWYEKIY